MIYHANDPGNVTTGSIGQLGDRESGLVIANAQAVDAAILADAGIYHVVSVGDLASSTSIYNDNNSNLVTQLKARGGNFFLTMGNHDYDVTNESYVPLYFNSIATNNSTAAVGPFFSSIIIGSCEFFMFDDNVEQGTTNGGGFSATASAVQASVAGQFIINKITNSSAPWKIFMTHHPAYTDSVDGNNSGNQWNFSNLCVNLYIQGHAHGVERIFTNGICYYTSATGGPSSGKRSSGWRMPRRKQTAG